MRRMYSDANKNVHVHLFNSCTTWSIIQFRYLDYKWFRHFFFLLSKQKRHICFKLKLNQHLNGRMVESSMLLLIVESLLKNRFPLSRSRKILIIGVFNWPRPLTLGSVAVPRTAARGKQSKVRAMGNFTMVWDHNSADIILTDHFFHILLNSAAINSIRSD